MKFILSYKLIGEDAKSETFHSREDAEKDKAFIEERFPLMGLSFETRPTIFEEHAE